MALTPPTNTVSNDDRYRLVTRGLLIILIVIGHNRLFHDSLYVLYVPLYTFHVSAFLFLPFLHKPKGFTSGNVLDTITRYLVPYMIAVTFYGVIYVIVARETGLRDWLKDYIAAITIGNAYFVKEATGFEMLWFLPAFTALVLAHMLISSIAPGKRRLILAASVAGHCIIGLVNYEMLKWVPASAYIVIYVFPLALVFGAIGNWAVANPLRAGVLSGAIFVVLSIIQHQEKWRLTMSEFTVYNVKNPMALITTDVSMVCGSIFVLALGSGLRRSAALALIGRYSMQIYLIHGIVGYAFVMITRRYLGDILSATEMMVVTIMLTIGVSTVAASLLSNSMIGKYCFPRHFADVSGLLALRRYIIKMGPKGE